MAAISLAHYLGLLGSSQQALEYAAYVNELFVLNEIFFALHVIGKIIAVVFFFRRSRYAVLAWGLAIGFGVADWILLTFNQFDSTSFISNLMLGIDLGTLLGLIHLRIHKIHFRVPAQA